MARFLGQEASNDFRKKENVPSLKAFTGGSELPKHSHFQGLQLYVYRESLELKWRKQKSDTSHLVSPKGCNRRRGKLNIFFKSQSLYKGRGRNFYKP